MILTSNTNIVLNNVLSNSNAAIKREVFPKKITGPSSIDSATNAIYKMETYRYKEGGIEKNPPPAYTTEQIVDWDADKNNIKWAFWVEDSKMKAKEHYITIENRTLISESSDNFMDIENDSDFREAVADYGYLEATIDTFVDNGVETNRLTIKFSKWFDGKILRVEAYRNGPEHNYLKDFVKSTTVNAQFEILDMYWTNLQGQRIQLAKYNSNIFLNIESLGLLGESITLTLKDDDTADSSTDDNINWSTSLVTKTHTFSTNKEVIPFTVETVNSAIFSAAQSDEQPSSTQLEIYISVSNTPTGLTIASGTKFAEINFISSNTVHAYFAKKEVIPNTTSIEPSMYFHKQDKAIPGQKLTLVLEAPNIPDTGIVNVTFSELIPLLNSPSGSISLLNSSDNEVISFAVTINNGLGYVDISFQKLDSPKYNAWVSSLLPSGGAINNSSLNIASVYNGTTYNSNSAIIIKAPIVIQKIYHDGYLSKEDYPQELIKKVKFEYHANDLSVHNFGVFNVLWAQKFKRYEKNNDFGFFKSGSNKYYYDGKQGTIKTPIVSIFDTATSKELNKTFVYDINTPPHDPPYLRFSDNSDREYFNPESLAAILGAIIKTGYNDITSQGCVELDNTGYPSKSHFNGINVDFRYLRTDFKRPLLDAISATNPKKVSRPLVSDTEFDESRMNTFIDCLYDFGFGRAITPYSKIKENYSYKFGNPKRLLHHCKHLEDHNHHLHAQGFKPNYK